MSNHLISEVYKRQVGGIARTAVMILMADKASDDGSGIWASKQRMADEIGASKQTIISTIKGLSDDGLIKEVGQRRCANGFTVEYAINLAVLRSLPVVACHDQSNSLTGQNLLPHQSNSLTPPVKQLDPNPPRTLLEPPISCPSVDEPVLKPIHIMEAWNDRMGQLGKPSIRDLTPARVQLCKARIGQRSLDDFMAVFDAIERSQFLREGRFCTFDWCMKAANFQKILEGNYDR